MTEKKFNLEAAKNGAVIKDGFGNEYEFIAHVPHAAETHQLLILEKKSKRITVRLANGVFHSGDTRWSLYTEPLTVTKYAILWMIKEPYEEAKKFTGDTDKYKIIPITYEV